MLPVCICQAMRWKLDCLPQISSVERMEWHVERQNAAVFYLFPVIIHNKQHFKKWFELKELCDILYPNWTGLDQFKDYGRLDKNSHSHTCRNNTALTGLLTFRWVVTRKQNTFCLIRKWLRKRSSCKTRSSRRDSVMHASLTIRYGYT